MCRKFADQATISWHLPNADVMEPRGGERRESMRDCRREFGHHMTDFDRRRLVLAEAAILLGTRSAIAQNGQTFTYRGIAVARDAGAAARAAP
jgi:hypothetical protein